MIPGERHLIHWPVPHFDASGSNIPIGFFHYEFRLKIRLQPPKAQAKPPRRELALKRIASGSTDECVKKRRYG